MINVLQHGITPGTDCTAQVISLFDRIRNEIFYFPGGTYYFSDPVVNIVGQRKIGIVGDGIGYTKFILTRAMDRFISIKTNEDNNNHHFRLADLSIQCGGFTVGTVLALSDCVYSSLQSVHIDGCWGTAVQLNGVWDSNFENIHVTNCGDNSLFLPAVLISDRSGKGENKGYQASNCIRWIGGRLESNRFYDMMVVNSRKIVIDGTKMHGQLPVAQQYEQLVIAGCNNIVVTNCNLTNSGRDSVGITSSTGVSLMANMINGAEGRGVAIGYSQDITVDTSLMGHFPPNKGGNVFHAKSKDVVILGNNAKN